MSAERLGRVSAEGVRVERVVVEASGRRLNVWVVGDDEECVVIDPPDGAAQPVLAAVGDRRLTAVLATCALTGEGSAAPELLEARPRTRIGLHHADLDAWSASHPDLEPNLALADGDTITSGDIEIVVIHTPGLSPGTCSFHAADLGVLFPGYTGVAASDRLASLDPDTVVLPAVGDPARLGDLDDPDDPDGGRARDAGSAHST